MRKVLMGAAAALLCIFILWLGGESTALAAVSPAVDSFSGNVEMMKKDGGNYVMQVTVGNDGEDFSGTVQLVFACSSDSNCAYNTEITLPAHGKKQFTVTVPERAVETVRGLCALNFLDEKGRLLWSVQLKNVFGNTMAGFPVGILSDNYSGLTFLDAGGRDFMIRGSSNPLNLVELDGANLKGYLDGLYFLVIDRFNVSTLGEENIQAIQDWVKEGGWLLLGTGQYAEWTLSGFEEDFQKVDILGITEPGEENAASVNGNYGNYYGYVDAGVDFTKMRIAELDYDSKLGIYYESLQSPAICTSLGDGAVMILTFSLGEEELRKLDDYVIEEMYDELMSNSNGYKQNGYSDMEYVGKMSLACIDSSNTDIDFIWLELLIGIYVILIGPILYLVLRKCKKSEWYWVCVPVMGLVFVAGVFFFGQEMRVNETKVYSVTVQKAESSQAETFLLAYHSGIKPWNMRLNDSYEVAGPGWGGYYRNYTTDSYHYMVGYDGDGIWVGMNPRENFESGFLYAGGRTDKKGSISGADIKGLGMGGNASGTITNGTVCDMSYLAVWDGSNIMVFSDVKAGETFGLQQALRDGRCVYQNSVSYYENLLYSMVSVYGYHSSSAYEQGDMAALLIGIGTADEAGPKGEGHAVAVGVVRDYENAVVSKCSEISYGCLYSYIETEVGEDASN